MKYSFLLVRCIQKPLLSHRRMRLAHWLQFLNKIDLRFVGPYSPCSQALLCNHEEQKPKYRSSRQSYLSGYCTDYFRRRAWLPTQSAAKPQNSFLTAPLKWWRGEGDFDPNPGMAMCYLKATRVQMGRVSCPGENEDSEQRGKGPGTSPCTQLPGRLRSSTGGFFKSPLKGGCKILGALMKTDVTRLCSPGSPWAPDIQPRTH